MNKGKYADRWATPPAVLGPAIVAVSIITLALSAFFISTDGFQQAMLTCAVGGLMLLIAVLDMIYEVIRQQKLIVDALENLKQH